MHSNTYIYNLDKIIDLIIVLTLYTHKVTEKAFRQSSTK